MRPSNVRRIVVEDFKSEDRETVGKLAEIINTYMDETTEVLQGNIDFDNMRRALIKADFTVDANGKPMGVSQINIGLKTYQGNHIINVQSLVGGENVVSTPYLDCTYQGNGLVKINKITGLPPGKKVRITFEFIG
jgi:hypothetical protein